MADNIFSSPSADEPVAGFWPSWVEPDLVAGRTLGLAEPQVVDGRLYWLESRPQEGGRVVLVSMGPDETPRDETSSPIDIGNAVHEYGGAPYAVCSGAGTDADGRARIVLSDRRTTAIMLRNRSGAWANIACMPESDGHARYADFAFDPGSESVFAISEHFVPGVPEPEATIVRLDPDGRIVPLVRGADFYAAPRPSPDGRYLAWVEWSHPDMPWDATRLCVAALHREEGVALATDRQVIAGGDGVRASVVEPVWTADGRLLASSDRAAGEGWAPVCFDPARGFLAEALPDPQAEIGLPHWVFGQRTLAPLPGGRLMALAIRDGLARVQVLEGDRWQVVSLGEPAWCPQPLGAAFGWLDTGAASPAAIVTGAPGGAIRVHRRAFELPEGVGPGDIARPEPMRFPTADGQEAYALFYRPANGRYRLHDDERPPLLVMAHGGPTGRAGSAFSFKVQWWTSRGFAVLDVNYRGSTGFGRAYREALAGRWGVRDVADCADAVQAVLARDLADPARCVIRGSSAGGLTVLESLASSTLFAAGASLYGVTDLRALAQETHKFESRYLDGLIGRWPQDEAVYCARSPVFHPERIGVPVLFLHGDQDKVVPLAQAQGMADRLRAQGNRVDMHVYAGEGHGFRQRETLLDSYARELAFYQSVFTEKGKTAG